MTAHELLDQTTMAGDGSITCTCGWTITWDHHREREAAHNIAARHIGETLDP